MAAGVRTGCQRSALPLTALAECNPLRGQYQHEGPEARRLARKPLTRIAPSAAVAAFIFVATLPGATPRNSTATRKPGCSGCPCWPFRKHICPIPAIIDNLDRSILFCASSFLAQIVLRQLVRISPNLLPFSALQRWVGKSTCFEAARGRNSFSSRRDGVGERTERSGGRCRFDLNGVHFWTLANSCGTWIRPRFFERDTEQQVLSVKGFRVHPCGRSSPAPSRGATEVLHAFSSPGRSTRYADTGYSDEDLGWFLQIPKQGKDT